VIIDLYAWWYTRTLLMEGKELVKNSFVRVSRGFFVQVDYYLLFRPIAEEVLPFCGFIVNLSLACSHGFIQRN